METSAVICGQHTPERSRTNLQTSQHLQSAVRSHPSFTHLISTRAIPTLYGVLPTVLQPRIFRFAATNPASTQSRPCPTYTNPVKTLPVFPFPVLSLPCRTSCEIPTHGVSRSLPLAFDFFDTIFVVLLNQDRLKTNCNPFNIPPESQRLPVSNRCP